MAITLRTFVILLNLVTFAICITPADKKDDIKVDAKENKDDLEPQETGWIFNPLQDKARALESLKDKVLYPFSALKSTGGYPTYTAGVTNTYNPWSYPSYSFTGSSYYPYPKPKQYNYSPGWSYKKPYATYPYKSWYNKNYYTTGGYHINTATYAPNCYYPSSGASYPSSTAAPPSYTSGTPLYYYYSSGSPSQSYGVPGVSFGAKAAVNVASKPEPVSYSSHFQPSAPQVPFSSYSFRVSSQPQFSDGNSQISNPSSALPASPSLPFSSSLSSISSSTYSPPSFPSVPSTPSPPFSSPIPPSVVSTTPSPPLISQSSISSGPSSIPIPIAYSGDEGISQEIIITPPPSSGNGHYVSTLPGAKIALPESSYSYNQPQYAVAYYPNVFYISNEQRLEKTSSTQSVGGTNDVPEDGTVVDSSSTSAPSSDSQSKDVSSPATKSQQSLGPLPGPGLTTFYSSQTLDQTRIPISSPGQFVAQQTPGSYYSSAVVPSFYSGVSGSYALPPGAPNTFSALTLPLPIGYSHGQPPAGYQITRTTKDC
ncbi:DNA-directed RNA polymerase II subunit RPB1-like [Macrosteles quadrilineatus]|uniref:DNA-directed RNA polymerase II subunit RPB1-like n=1 Tax=Macrosteles quadrilineatus TaxID=74068 RepID=UPI0023E2C141|nr:DNA-directed RNA polymerase II subunit RPB1-like [Macrosteles quadrilineatus]